MTTGIRYEIRAALRSDHARLVELARYLDSVNLPHDEAAILEVVEQSEDAFSGKIGDARRRQYVFVLIDLEADRAVGTSMIIGQLGRKDAPYIYFDVHTEEKYSPMLDRHFVHQVLSMGYSFNGPTEIGGLVMHPDYRRVPEKLGMLISYVRFLFIAAHREDFRDQILAELLPPLEADGTSHLWEAVGRHFTEMTYKEADRLSKRNKEFVRALFPDGDIYASLLPKDAQAVIGKVGRETRGVETLLKRIGFRYANRVDPFDGGPHFIAQTDEITLVERTAASPVSIGEAHGKRALVARQWDVAPFFRAIAVPCVVRRGSVEIGREAAAHLGVEAGDEVIVLGLD
jgi:arginine N-succinyltransferase